ncbi:MAG TPA: twin-arginine translocation signal domain-containing protein [Pyrinomonadaceae bacterium]|jgi:hypothetical protein
MFISRRKFLQAGTVIAVAAGVPLKTAVVVTGKRNAPPQSSSPVGAQASTPVKTNTLNHDSLASYTKATFAAHLNSSFVIKSKRARAVEVKLVEINDAGPVPDQQLSGKECFSLVFRTSQRLRQDVYEIEHATLGKFELLLVPVGKDRKGSYYEALINRLH